MALPLFVGGADHNFNVVGGTTGVSTATNVRRTSYAHCALTVTGNGPAEVGYVSQAWSASSGEFYFAARVYPDHTSGATTTQDFISLRIGTTRKIIIRPAIVSTSPTLVAYKRTNGGTETQLGSATPVALADKALNHIAGYVKYAAAGALKLWINGTLALDYSGDVTTDSDTALNAMVIGALRAGAGTVFWSEVLVHPSDARSMSLVSLQVSGAGNVNTAASGTYADVDEVITSDADLVTMNAAGQNIQFALNSSVLGGSASVHAVVLTGRVMRGATGPTKLEPNVRTGGTDYYATGVTLDTAFQNLQHAWDTNPQTSATWLASAIKAGAFNLGFRAAA